MGNHYFKKFLALWVLVFAVFSTTSCDKNIIDELEAGKRPGSAKEKLADVIKKEPGNTKAQKWMAVLELENDEVSGAESRVAMMVVKFPKEYDTYYAACQLYLTKKDSKESIIFCEKAVEASDKPPVSDLYFLAMAYMDSEKYEKAFSRFEEAHKKSPKNADLINNMGFCEMNRGNYDNAIKLFKKAVALDTGQINAWKNLARTYYDQGNYKESANTQEQALKYAPKDTELLVNLAIIYYMHLDDPIKGFQFFEMARSCGLDEKKAEQALNFIKNQAGSSMELGKQLR